jgi:putative antitoxin of VapBC-like toxin-antitoxin system
LVPPPRNRAIDAELLDQALSVGGFRTKRETVNQALREFIARRHRLELVDLFGKVDYDPSYDYKKERRAR